jgi:hypothetical protein
MFLDCGSKSTHAEIPPFLLYHMILINQELFGITEGLMFVIKEGFYGRALKIQEYHAQEGRPG